MDFKTRNQIVEEKMREMALLIGCNEYIVYIGKKEDGKHDIVTVGHCTDQFMATILKDLLRTVLLKEKTVAKEGDYWLTGEIEKNRIPPIE